MMIFGCFWCLLRKVVLYVSFAIHLQYLHIYKYIYIYIYTGISLSISLSISIYLYIHTHTHIYIYRCVCVCLITILYTGFLFHWIFPSDFSPFGSLGALAVHRLHLPRWGDQRRLWTLQVGEEPHAKGGSLVNPTEIVRESSMDFSIGFSMIFPWTKYGFIIKWFHWEEEGHEPTGFHHRTWGFT